MDSNSDSSLSSLPDSLLETPDMTQDLLDQAVQFTEEAEAARAEAAQAEVTASSEAIDQIVAEDAVVAGQETPKVRRQRIEAEMYAKALTEKKKNEKKGPRSSRKRKHPGSMVATGATLKR
jgi:hypothetical protein